MDNVRKAREQRRATAALTVQTIDKGFYETEDGVRVDVADALHYCQDRTIFFPPDFKLKNHALAPSDRKRQPSKTTYAVEDAGTLSCARRLACSGFNVAALNFASARNPGGGFLNGAEAQEENLSRHSGLYAAQTSEVGRAFYNISSSRRSNDGTYTHALLLSPRVPVWRTDEGELLKEPWYCAFITAAAPNAGQARKSGLTESAIEALLAERAARVLSVAASQGYDALVLGAWGCGVFKNSPAVVAGIFSKLLATTFAGTFRHVTFGILGADAMRTPFIATFGELSMAANTVSDGGLSTAGASSVPPTRSDAAAPATLSAEGTTQQRPMTKADRRALQEQQRAAKTAARIEAEAVCSQVFLVRHGEGTHNVRRMDRVKTWKQRGSEIDPQLTENGVEQASNLVGHPLLSSADLVVVSPLSRAVHTAALAFGEAPSAARRVVLTPLHSERWCAPCDEGRPKSELVQSFPFIRLWEGFAELPEHWTPTKATDAAWAELRVPAFLSWLDAQPEARIVVVGHGAFFGRLLGRHLKNCEVALLTTRMARGVQQAHGRGTMQVAASLPVDVA